MCILYVISSGESQHFVFRPIYAFHTRFDKNGFFMGGTSGFHGIVT